MAHPKLVLFFDLDGTVLDVSHRHHRIYMRVTNAFGGTPLGKDEYWRLKQQRLPWPVMLERSQVPADKLDDFMAMFIAEIEKPDELAQDPAILGAPETLQRLHAQGYEMYLVSLRRGHEKFLQQLAHLDLAQYFTETLSGHTDASTDELKAGLISKRLKGRSGMMIGDTEADVLAGKRLAMVTIGVTSGIRSREFLRSLEPDYLLGSIAELPAVLERL